MKTLKTLALAATATLAACDGEGTSNVGPDGGEVTSADGKLSLSIPAGALDHDIFVTIGEVDDCADALGACYEIEPFGTVLSLPATLTYYYGDDINGTVTSSTVDEREIVLVTEREHGWWTMADRVIDVDAQTVAASTAFLGTYTITLRQ